MVDQTLLNNTICWPLSYNIYSRINLLTTIISAFLLLILPRIIVAFTSIETCRCRRKEWSHKHRIIKLWWWRRPHLWIRLLEYGQWWWHLLWVQERLSSEAMLEKAMLSRRPLLRSRECSPSTTFRWRKLSTLRRTRRDDIKTVANVVALLYRDGSRALHRQSCGSPAVPSTPLMHVDSRAVDVGSCALHIAKAPPLHACSAVCRF